MVTYGDGVADINIADLLKFHKIHGKFATVTTVQPPGRYGSLKIAEEGAVTTFLEKPKGDGVWVNGGFFVLESSIFDYIEGDSTIWEKEPMEILVMNDHLMAYKHYGFWRPMDTLRDKIMLDDLWKEGHAPWKMWS